MITLTDDQAAIVHLPLQSHISLQGTAGSGKTTAGVQRMLQLVASGFAADSILILVPQRSLAQPYYSIIHTPDFPSGGQPATLTFGGLAQRMVSLFWPLVAKVAGFKKPTNPPRFLTLETAQYYLATIVDPLLQQGYFESLVIDPNRLYSQILDNLNKSAIVGFSPDQIAERLIQAWSGKPTQHILYQQAQECALRFRELCYRDNLLDFSLQLDVFRQHLWPSLICRSYLKQTYHHLIYDNIEDDFPVAHDCMAEWLPDFQSALLIMDEDAGFRTFLGADVSSASRLAAQCTGNLRTQDSFVNQSDMLNLERVLSESIQKLPHPNQSNNNQTAFTINSCRFYPQAIDQVVNEAQKLILDQGVNPSEIAILTPFLSDALRFAFSARLEAAGVPYTTYRPSRSLRDEPVVKAILTFARLANPTWAMQPHLQDVRNAFHVAFYGCDLVRSDLLAQILYKPLNASDSLRPFQPVNPEKQARITYLIGERYELLREWLTANRDQGSLELDHWISRLFGEVLSQPGFGLHTDFEGATLVARMIESARKFRQSLTTPKEPTPPFGKEYLRVLESGILSAQSLSAFEEQSQADTVFLSPAFSFLMRNRPVRVQFWVDIGSQGWWSRLDQPLTQPYVLNRNWGEGRKWTDEDEFLNNQRSLLRVTRGLIRRCYGQIHMFTIALNEQGVEERGALVLAMQDVLRSQGKGAHG